MGKRKLIFLNKDDWLDWILPFRFVQRQNDDIAGIPRHEAKASARDDNISGCLIARAVPCEA